MSLRVSLKLHQLIRGLVVICYHHAGFRKQHGLGFAQPYRGTELSLLVWWMYRESNPICRLHVEHLGHTSLYTHMWGLRLAKNRLVKNWWAETSFGLNQVVM